MNRPLSLMTALLLLSPLTALTPIPDQSHLNIKTPSLQERKVAKFALDNGLKVYVVTDPLLDKSGAALMVGRGSLDEPKQFPGLAHFLEHMLFMGTEKYPDENHYWNFISIHGGQTNAFTDGDRTVYMFAISNDAFLEALDQFSWFFTAPLFKQEGIDKERHAVDQEFRNYISNDDWRSMALLQSLSLPDSPLSRFTVGSLETLSSVTTQDLKEWWQTHYSAKEMALVIYSPLPLDLIEKAVTEDFAHLPDPSPSHTPLSYSLNSAVTNKLIRAVSVQDSHALYFYFDLDASYYNQAKLLEKALTDEAEGSLQRYLEVKGLASSVEVMMSHASERLPFLVKIELTAKGTQNYEEVIEDFFGTLRLFQQQGIDKTFFDQAVQAAKVSYAYQTPDNVFKKVMKDATALRDEDIATYPDQTEILTDYDPEKLTKLLQGMDLSHSYVLLLTPQNIAGAATEKWFGTRYKIEEFPEGFLTNKELLPEISLRATNPFLPTSFTLVDQKETSLLPEKIYEQESALFYWLADQQFHLPVTTLILHIIPEKKWRESAKSALLRDLIASAVKYKLEPLLYQASEVGSSLSFEEKEGAFLLKVATFSSATQPVIKQIAETIKTLSLTSEEFETIKSSLLQSYQNTLSAEPYLMGISLCKEVLSYSAASYEKKASLLRKMSFTLFEKERENLFKKIALQGFFFGNISSHDAEESAGELQKTFQTSALSSPYDPAFFVATKGPVSFTKKIKQLGNFAALILEESCFTYKKEAALCLLNRSLIEPFFSELRTQQQTGYIVKNSAPTQPGLLAEIFFAQSTTHDPEELLYRFELFLENFSLDEERFTALKKSYLEELEAPEKSPLEKAEKYDKMAFLLKGNFSWHDKRQAAAKELTYKEFTDFTRSFLARSNKKRIALLLKGQEQGERALRFKAVASVPDLLKEGGYQSWQTARCP